MRSNQRHSPFDTNSINKLMGFNPNRINEPDPDNDTPPPFEAPVQRPEVFVSPANQVKGAFNGGDYDKEPNLGFPRIAQRLTRPEEQEGPPETQHYRPG